MVATNLQCESAHVHWEVGVENSVILPALSCQPACNHCRLQNCKTVHTCNHTHNHTSFYNPTLCGLAQHTLGDKALPPGIFPKSHIGTSKDLTMSKGTHVNIRESKGLSSGLSQKRSKIPHVCIFLSEKSHAHLCTDSRHFFVITN